MVRLCMGLAVAWLLVGCTGYQMGGKWIGRLPLGDSGPSKIRFYPEGRFDFVSSGAEVWVGQGDYRVVGERLTLTYRWVSLDGKVLKDVPRPLDVNIRGERNKLVVTLPNREEVIWDRRL